MVKVSTVEKNEQTVYLEGAWFLVKIIFRFFLRIKYTLNFNLQATTIIASLEKENPECEPGIELYTMFVNYMMHQVTTTKKQSH